MVLWKLIHVTCLWSFEWIFYTISSFFTLVDTCLLNLFPRWNLNSRTSKILTNFDSFFQTESEKMLRRLLQRKSKEISIVWVFIDLKSNYACGWSFDFPLIWGITVILSSKSATVQEDSHIDEQLSEGFVIKRDSTKSSMRRYFEL